MFVYKIRIKTVKTQEIIFLQWIQEKSAKVVGTQSRCGSKNFRNVFVATPADSLFEEIAEELKIESLAS